MKHGLHFTIASHFSLHHRMWVVLYLGVSLWTSASAQSLTSPQTTPTSDNIANAAASSVNTTTLGNNQLCADVFGLTPTTARRFDSAQGQWWFTPASPPTAPNNTPIAQSLSVLPDRDNQWQINGDTLALRWRSIVADTPRWARAQTYWVVRSDIPVTDGQGRAIGQFSRLIAKAVWDKRVQIQTNDLNSLHPPYTWLAPLQITQSIEEVQNGDAVIPTTCFAPKNPVPAAMVFKHVGAPIISRAKIIGLMDKRRFGEQSTIAVIDQGAEEGVDNTQTWLLAETVASAEHHSDNAAISGLAKTHGQVELLQILNHVSLVRIGYTDTEVARGTELIRSAQTSLRSH